MQQDHKRRYKIKIAYEGTHYSGWQYQPNAMSIQQMLEEKLQVFLKENISIQASGRTDAGVHAIGQIGHFDFSCEIDLEKFIKAASGLLPKDIRIMQIEPVSHEFHARYSASGKEYHYCLHLDPVMNPFQRYNRHHVKGNFDLAKLKQAAALFVGKHDFTSFANEPQAGSVSRNPVRHLRKLDVIEIDGGVALAFEANGFLYKMVRNITGTLIEVGKGKLAPEDIPRLFDAKDRRKAGKSAPALGLTLIEVRYPSTAVIQREGLLP